MKTKKIKRADSYLDLIYEFPLRLIRNHSQSLVSMILSGNRELSKGNIKALVLHFKVEPGLFL